MKKKALLLCLLFVGMLFLTGCSDLPELPSEPHSYEAGTWNDGHNEYRTIRYNSKTYIAFGEVKSEGLFGDYTYAFGNCLGYIESDTNDRIYALKEDYRDEWLIEYYVNGEMENPVVYRDYAFKGDKNIPSSVESSNYKIWFNN